MSYVWYDVPMVKQGANPICWIACMAMIAAERESHSPDIQKYNNGFNPSNSSSPNLAISFSDFVTRLRRCGFDTAGFDPTADQIGIFLRDFGPFILTHNCNGFPYGARYKPLTSGVHAVVITGLDTSGPGGGTCWMNNPWGDKDEAILPNAVVRAIISFQNDSRPAVAYYSSLRNAGG